MLQKKGKNKLFTTLVVLAAVVIIIGVVAIVKAMSSDQSSVSTDTTTQDAPAVTDDSESTETPPSTDSSETEAEPTIDPATVATVAIEPISLTVTYLKGVGGFDFEVLRAAGGTKYVQFSSPRLVGTKCTDDKGQFASIIESPSADESATLAKTTVVDGTTYGLSLADTTCTSDAELLKQYQNAFSEPFSLLKKM